MIIGNDWDLDDLGNSIVTMSEIIGIPHNTLIDKLREVEVGICDEEDAELYKERIDAYYEGIGVEFDWNE